MARPGWQRRIRGGLSLLGRRWRQPPLPATQDCKPDFLGIGAQKAGTSWLYQQLRKHPALFLPPIKELHYFDHHYIPAFQSWTGAHIDRGVQRLRDQYPGGRAMMPAWYRDYVDRLDEGERFSETWYRNAFRHPDAMGRVRGEITPEYCSLPEEGIDYLLETFAPVKVIYIVRDPLQRALSHLRMNIKRKGAIPADRDAWLTLCAARAINHRGDYRTYIPRWRSALGEQGVLLLPFGQIRTAPESLMRRVEDFLGVAAHDYPALAQAVHAGDRYEIPDFVIERLSVQLADQQRFLRDTFDADFLEAL